MDNLLRQPPYNLEAEQSILGAILIKPECIATVAEKLGLDDFYLLQHKLIYEGMLSLWNRSEAVDAVTLSNELGQNLETIGGYTYLAQLADMVPTLENLRAYIAVVEESAIRRKLIEAAGKISQISHEEGENLSSVLDASEKYIYDVLQSRAASGFTHVSDVMVKSFENIEYLSQNRGKIHGVQTGFRDLDKITGGLQSSDLIIVAARPAMGKSSFALNVAQYAAIHAKVPVAVFNLEMSAEQVGNRIIWSEALISGEKIRTGEIADDEWPVLAGVIANISAAPMYIDDTPGITVTEIRAKCKRLQLEKGLGLIVIDYLQLMQSGKRNENRQQEISEISRSLKILAKELDVPVVALSQLSRATESRSGHRPQLSDLRESGAIEQDADIVMFLHRPSYYDPEAEDDNLAECIIAKHRNGPVGRIEMMWDGQYTRFRSLGRGFE